MNINQLRVVGAGLLYLFIFLSGIWLSHSGKPYSVIIFAIHKLISVVAVVFLGRTIYQISQVAKLSGVGLVAVVVTSLLFLGTIASGGLLSTDKPMPAAISTMHQITPFLTVLSTAVTIYLLASGK